MPPNGFVYKVKITIEKTWRDPKKPAKYPIMLYKYVSCDEKGNERFFGKNTAMFRAVQFLWNFDDKTGE